MIVDRIAALFRVELHIAVLQSIRMRACRRERSVTHLASVAVRMVAAIERNDANGLGLARRWKDHLMARVAARRELLMETVDAVDLHGGVDGKWNSVETLRTRHAAEALSVVGLARRSEDLNQRGVRRERTFALLTRSVIGCAQATHFSKEF